MASFTKVVVSLSIVLTILVASKVNVGESKGFLIPEKTVVKIINKLSNNMQLGFHCQDKKHDFGVLTLQPNQDWSFKFQPNPFWDSTLYYCSFTWTNTLKHFDVYRETRDKDKCTECDWEIAESGPCRVTDEFRDCYDWKNETQTLVVGRKQLGIGNIDNLGV